MLEYKYDFTLQSDVNLTLYLFSHEEHRRIYKYILRNHKVGDYELYNELTVAVDYESGKISDKLEITMDIVNPEKRGKKFYVGVDISPGGRIFHQFIYKRKGDDFQLSELIIGASNRFSLEDMKGDELIKSADMPFPVLDVIKKEFGEFKIPFIHADGDIRNIEIPESVIK